VVEVEVPVHFRGEEKSPGLERGGVLNVVAHTVEVKAGVDNLPEHVEVDLAGLEIGDIVHASAVKLPQGVSFVADDLEEFTIATIAAPTVVAEEAAEEQAEIEAEKAAEEAGETEEAEGEEGEGEAQAEDGEAKAEDGEKKSDD